jgi:hypothetical protein
VFLEKFFCSEDRSYITANNREAAREALGAKGIFTLPRCLVNASGKRRGGSGDPRDSLTMLHR